MSSKNENTSDQDDYLLELYTETFYPGIILEADAFTATGEKVINKDEPVTKELIEKLKADNINCLYYSLSSLSSDELIETKEFIVVEMDIKSLYPGIALKGDAYKPDGTILVRRGETITAGIIKSLEDQEIHKFNYNKPVYSKISQTFVEQYIVSNALIEKSLYLAKEIEKCILKKAALPKAEIDSIIDKLVGEISISETYTILNLLKLKEFDDMTYFHSINVAMLAILFGKTMLFSQEKLKLLGIGGILHDLGKLLVPKELLNKKENLTDKEWQTIQKHPLYGYDILKTQKDFNKEVEKCILWHHENYDGTGYPFQLSRDKMGELAEIVSIADFYDAMTSPKPYRPEYPIWFTFLAIQNQSGKKFHPRLTTEFINRMPGRLLWKADCPAFVLCCP